MRGRPRRAHDTCVVSLSDFGWDTAAVACLRHPTLPWYERVGAQISLPLRLLPSVGEIGTRDRLSLVAQYAAHEAFLQFAGVPDGGFDPAEWGVVQKRGSDCRLVRIAACSLAGAQTPPAISLVDAFAHYVRTPALDVLRRPWARAEAVYCEAFARVVTDAVSDQQWLRRAVHGSILSPGLQTIRYVVSSRGRRFRFADLAAIDSLESWASIADDVRVVVLRGVSPLQRYSALQKLHELVPFDLSAPETSVAEAVLPQLAESATVILDVGDDAFDSASRRVADLLRDSGAFTWLDTREINTNIVLSPTSHFVVAPTLTARRKLNNHLDGSSAGEWIEAFAASPDLQRFLASGEMSERSATLPAVTEPRRSYLGAMALLGQKSSIHLVSAFLEKLNIRERIDDLLIDGIVERHGESIEFVSRRVRDTVLDWLPLSSRRTLTGVAAEVSIELDDPLSAGALLGRECDPRAVGHLERALDTADRAEVAAVLSALPVEAFRASNRLIRFLADTWIEDGRYDDARELAAHAEPPLADFLLARIERRTGLYTAALERIEACESGRSDFETQVLLAELLYINHRFADARRVLEAITPSTTRERTLHGYAGALVAAETGMRCDDTWSSIAEPLADYLGARLDGYQAFAANDLNRALRSAEDACRKATSRIEAIDAAVDRVFALFCSGRWSDARSEAMEALTLVDETQGDRAAGGLLFLLAYLAADDGQWVHAEHRIVRLRRHYADTQDEVRLAELDLLAAHLDFCRGRFSAAKKTAQSMLGGDLLPQIREAAALIVDEIHSIEKTNAPLLSTGASGNVEFTERHQVIAARRGSRVDEAALSLFHRHLLLWERGESQSPPNASTGTEKLKVFRSALLRSDMEVANALATELDLTVKSMEDGRHAELRALRAVLTTDYPFTAGVFDGLDWCLATRNRLGQWQQIGSRKMSPAELDGIDIEQQRDWIPCSDRELLFLSGVSVWSEPAREALAAAVHLKAENFRLRRLVEQEDVRTAPMATHSIDGMIGDSPAMRDVAALIAVVARRDVPVCILGESGTGKELAARGLHRLSLRKSKPFIAINCAALPENLVESELFGHVRGAFTGADRDRPGVIESCDGGTLFLDEIGDVPLSVQAKLLRFLQDGEYRRVGDVQNRSSDVRIVCATNRPLEEDVEKGRFREDLYYRLRGVEILLPPLRERIVDVPLLSQHFLALERERARGGATLLSPDVEAIFATYSWPGNIRELQNSIRGAHAMAGERKTIEVEHLPERLRRVVPRRTTVGSYQDAVASFRRDLIEKSLLAAGGNQNQAATMLKISRQALAYQIRELGILVKPGRGANPRSHP